MAGIVPLSFQTAFDSLGRPMPGAKLHTFQAGTTTPQSTYQDSGLTIAHPNPVLASVAARLPMMWAADGNIKLRLDSSEGVTELAEDNVLVFGPSSGEGGGASVDANSLISTGDIKVRYGTGALAGYVRCNGRSIGSATSSATERANADTEALFLHLWNEDENLTVSTGRGANAAADWAANKTITLPDGRGRILVGDAAMGASTSNIFSGVTFNSPGDSTTLGSTAGFATRTLTSAQIPIITPSGTVAITDPGHAHNVAIGTNTPNTQSFLALPASSIGGTLSGGANGVNTALTGISATFTGTAWNPGGGNAHETISPIILITTYIRL